MGFSQALCESIFALLEKHGVQRDMPAAFSELGCYVTEPVWRPQSTVGSKGGKSTVVTSSSQVATQRRAGDAPRKTGICISHDKPTERELEKTLKRDKRDWSLPLYPSGRGFRHHLGSKTVEHEEWAQMGYGEKMTDEVQLRDS